MTYKCIKCKTKWTEGPKTRLCSHGFCRSCGRIEMTPLAHKKQLREGNWPCFATAGTYCDRLNCKYRKICLKKECEV